MLYEVRIVFDVDFAIWAEVITRSEANKPSS